MSERPAEDQDDSGYDYEAMFWDAVAQHEAAEEALEGLRQRIEALCDNSPGGWVAEDDLRAALAADDTQPARCPSCAVPVQDQAEHAPVCTAGVARE